MDDLDLLHQFTIAAEGQNDDVVMWCTACTAHGDHFEHVETGNSPASNLLIAARDHWTAKHSGGPA